eukprot:gene9819-2012_t
MSRCGELTAIVLDVGPSMSTKLPSGSSHLQSAVKAIDYFIRHKILHSKKDEVALITFGDNDTDNQISPDLDMLRYVENEIEPGDVPADFIDALIVGMDCLVTSSSGKKGAKKLFLFTDAASPVNDSSLDDINKGINLHSIDLRIIGVGIDEEDEEEIGIHKSLTDVQQSNIKIIKTIIEAVNGETYSFKSALELLTQFRKRQIKPTATFRGCLNIADLKIPVFLYIEEKREPRPRLEKLSALVDLDVKDGNSAKVDREVTYHRLNDDDTEVPSDRRIKGYKYGRTIVPWEKIHEQNLTLNEEKGLSVICFTNANNVPRHHFIDSLICVLPANDDEHAARAIACLLKALEETNSVAIVRYVFRLKAAPKIGMIFQGSVKGNKGLYYVSLPFREDIRPYEFASLTNNPLATFNKEQQQAAENLVRSMDLMKGLIDEDGDEVEAYDLSYTFNPCIQMFYQCVNHRALHPHDPLPELDPIVANHINPSELILKRSSEAQDTFKRSFDLREKAVKGKKTASQMFSVDDSALKRSKLTLEKTDSFSMANLMQKKVTQVGSTTPVEDFLALISEKTSDNLMTVSEQLMSRIQDFVDLYTGGDVSRFTNMIQVLRKELTFANPMIFNSFLRRLVAELKQHMAQRKIFWDELKQHNLTLISSSESAASDVSQLEADKFLEEQESSLSNNSQSGAVDEEEDLLDEL